MADSLIPPFEQTPMDAIPGIASRVRRGFLTQKTKPLAYRLQQLNKLYWGLIDNTPALLEACMVDLHKSAFETHISDLSWCTNDIVFVTKNLAKWMKDESAPDIALTHKATNPKIRKDPLGAVLIIGCWNFPIQLSIGPLIGAIAAGCTAVLKPSEVSPATAMVLKKVIEKSLDPDCYAVVSGAAEETTLLLNSKWDKILYTGNESVGKIIAKKAAETLTPVCLELGGRNPAIITKYADLRLAARRMLWGKFHNAGQVCISQNYLMVDQEIVSPFVEELKTAIKEFFPHGMKESPDFGRIVNKRHFLRIKKMIDSTNGKILIGGGTDESDNFIEITVVLVDSPNDSLISEESFGPVIPILPVKDLDEAIRVANEVHSTPLALYPFGSKTEVERIITEVQSGGVTVNDAFFHGSIPTLQFGGVGSSGQGAYRGKASFDVFTHRRPIVKTPGWIEGLLSVRYPPYAGKLKKYQATANLKPQFDRNGKKIRGIGYWVGLLFSLGGESSRNTLMRWVVLVAIALGARRYVENKGLSSHIK